MREIDNALRDSVSQEASPELESVQAAPEASAEQYPRQDIKVAMSSNTDTLDAANRMDSAGDTLSGEAAPGITPTIALMAEESSDRGKPAQFTVSYLMFAFLIVNIAVAIAVQVKSRNQENKRNPP